MSSGIDFLTSSGLPPLGGPGQVLTVVGGQAVWANSASGFANPMTAPGDLIVGGVAGAGTRLVAGATNAVLTVVAGTPTWVAPAGTSQLINGTNTFGINANGDLVTGPSPAGISVAPGAGAGSTGTATLATGSNRQAGAVTVVPSGTGLGAGAQAVFTASPAYASLPRPIVVRDATVGGSNVQVAGVTTGGFSINLSTSPNGGSSYTFYYAVFL